MVVDVQEKASELETYQGSRAYLMAVCFVAAMGGVLFGFDTAVISGTIVFLKAQFQLTPIMEGWVVSSALLGCIVGAMAAGVLSDRYGRKSILLLSGVLFLFTAFGCAFAQSVSFIAISRFVGGTGVGIASMLSPLYIAEFSPPHLRGRMVSLYQFAITGGILLAYLSNTLLLKFSQTASPLANFDCLRWLIFDEVWRGMFGAMALPAIMFFILLLFVPESPRWLVKQGRSKKAFKILSKIGGSEVARLELVEISKAIKAQSGSMKQLFERGMRMALLIGIALPMFSQVTGINVIIYYGSTIFEKAGFARNSSLGFLAIIGVVLMLFTLIAIWKVDQIGRKPLLKFGSVSVTSALLLIGVLFYQGIGNSPMLLLLLCFHVASFAFSFGPLTWVVISEIFPTRIRGRAMSIGAFCVWITCGLVAQTFPWLRDNLGPTGTFWLYAALLSPSILFAWKLIPETKGKTLEEIERSWHYKV